MSADPIGIFDSGIGGLTVAQAINKLLPTESLIYFGDTCLAPWGDKSESVIEHYAVTICEFLLAQHCKVIVIACNTASAVAYNYIKQYVGQRAHIINVIDPTVDYISQTLTGEHIGIIGTKQTIASANYATKLAANAADISVHSLATPLLVPLIEEGFIDKLPCRLILEEYLANPILANITALILGCTHYPLLKAQISAFYNNKVRLIDAADLTANYLQQLLMNANLANTNSTNHSGNAQKQFFISDYNPHFIKIAQQFFTDYTLTPYQLWEDKQFAKNYI